MTIFKKVELAFSSLIMTFVLTLPQEFSKLRVKYYNWKGCKIHPKAFLSPNVRITGKFEMGEGSSLAQNCSVSGESVGVFIGKNVMVAPNVTIVAFNHGFEDLEIPMVFQKNIEAPITIHDDVWIASNCSIGKGVVIGRGAIIGANTFVNKDVLPYSIMGGVPAKLIRFRNQT